MNALDRARLRVDFNELVEEDLVLLSVEDEKTDSDGNRVLLKNGMRVYLYMEDADEGGRPTNLLATGVVEENRAAGWAAHVEWCCRIDGWGR